MLYYCIPAYKTRRFFFRRYAAVAGGGGYHTAKARYSAHTAHAFRHDIPSIIPVTPDFTGRHA